MAKNAKVKAIGVSWGYHKHNVLEEHGAEVIVSTVKDLKTAILNILR